MIREINILMEAGFVFLNFVIFLFNYKISRKQIMQPAVLYSGLWAVILLLHLIARTTILNQLFDVSAYTFSIVTIGNLSFSLGSLLISVLKEKRESHPLTPYQPWTWLIKLSPIIQFSLFFIILFGLPYYLLQSYKIFLASNIDNFFVGLRTELAYGDAKMGPEVYLTSLSYFNLAIQQYCYYHQRNRTNRIIFFTSILLALTYALFTTGRGPILWVLTIIVGMNFLNGYKFTIKRVFLTIIAFLLFFSLIGVYFGKGGNTENTFSENLKSSTEVTGTYMVASINALDQRIEENPEPNYTGSQTLRFFFAVGSALGIVNFSEVSSLLQEFVFVPYTTNVYTIYSPYISDFGIYYAFIMVGFYGLIQTLIYNKALQTKNIRYSVYYSLTLFPLFMSFFQDMYISLLSTWIQMFLYTEIILILNRFLIRRND